MSYLRLTPNRWAPTNVDIVKQDRGAALRVCPVFGAAKKKDMANAFNLEFRVCDASASPYLALGALLFAGADGIARKLALPAPGQSLETVAAFARRGPRPHGSAAKRCSAGSGPCSSTHICGTSAPSWPMSPGSTRPSFAPAMRRFIERQESDASN